MLALIIRVMPYSLVVLHIWIWAALAVHQSRQGRALWWMLILSGLSQGLVCAIVIGSLRQESSDPTGIWVFGISYALLLALPVAIVTLIVRGHLQGDASLADLTFAADAPGSAGPPRRGGTIALCLSLALISAIGVFLQPCAPGDLLLGVSGCVRTLPMSDTGLLRFAPDGSRFLTVSFEEQGEAVQIWDGRSGRPQLRLEVGDDVDGTAFSRDGGTLAVVTPQGTAQIWELATGARRASLALGAPASALALSPDGSLLAVGSEQGATLWHWDGGAYRQEPFAGDPGRPVSALAWSADGALLAVAASREGGGLGIAVWNVRAGRRVSAAAEGPARNLQFFPDGRTLIAGGEYFSERPLVRAWDVASGRLLREVALDAYRFVGVAVSPDGALVAATDGKRLYVWPLGSDAAPQAIYVGRTADSLVFVDRSTVAVEIFSDAVRLWRVAP